MDLESIFILFSFGKYFYEKIGMHDFLEDEIQINI